MELDDIKKCIWVYPKLSSQHFLRFAQVGSLLSKVYFSYLLISKSKDPAGTASRKAKMLSEKIMLLVFLYHRVQLNL